MEKGRSRKGGARKGRVLHYLSDLVGGDRVDATPKGGGRFVEGARVEGVKEDTTPSYQLRGKKGWFPIHEEPPLTLRGGR